MSETARGSWQKLFESNLELIEGAIRRISKRYRLGSEDREDFRSRVLLKFIEGDYAVLRKFKGRSSLSTYIFITVQRLMIDRCRGSGRGRWRPTTKAERLGKVALELEKLIYRDGWTAQEACQVLRTDRGAEDSPRRLMQLVERIPVRYPRRWSPVNEARLAHGDPSPEEELIEREKRGAFTTVVDSLRTALESLEPEDRLILELRFYEGFTIPRIADSLGIKPRRLYSRIERLLKLLRNRIDVTEVPSFGSRSVG